MLTHRAFLLLALSGLFILVSVSSSFADHAWRQADGTRRHWSDAAGNGPGIVYWVDNTGPEWPVLTAAIDWDQEERLNGVYVSSASNCPRHCVNVHEEPLADGCSPPFGSTFGPAHDNGHFLETTNVAIDAQCDNRDYATRRELVCHELGHTTGLDDEPHGADTCMRGGALDEPEQVEPRKHDYDVLHDVYGHDG
jgi:hypothetical protein